VSGEFAVEGKVLGCGASASGNLVLAVTGNMSWGDTESKSRRVDITVSNAMSNDATWTSDGEDKSIITREELLCDDATGYVYDPTTGDQAWRLGTVTQYRTVTFFSDVKTANHDHLFNNVIDAVWFNNHVLSNPQHPAHALVNAKSVTSSPWRVHHAVTHVERVLPKATSNKGSSHFLTLTSMVPVSSAIEQYIIDNKLENVCTVDLSGAQSTELARALLVKCRTERLLWLFKDATLQGYAVDTGVSLTQIAEQHFEHASIQYMLSSDDPVEINRLVSADSYYANASDVRGMSNMDVFPKARTPTHMLEFTEMNASSRRRHRLSRKTGHQNINVNSEKRLRVMIEQVWINAADLQRKMLMST
jgi:hypothetical protein